MALGRGIFEPDAEMSEFSEDMQVEADAEYFDEDTDESLYKWNIRYHFSNGIRDNSAPKGTYGSKNVTFQSLFKILIKLNGGVNFIDNYINTILPDTELGKEMEEWLNDLANETKEEYDRLHKTKAGNIDRRYTRGIRTFVKFMHDNESAYGSLGKNFSKEIKQDIVTKLSYGELQLTPNWNTFETKVRRLKAGLPVKPRFFATEQFINNISLTCSLEREGDIWNQDILG